MVLPAQCLTDAWLTAEFHGKFQMSCRLKLS